MNNRLVTFSFLAQINDNTTSIKSFNDIFIPLIKIGLCRMNNDGIKDGKSILEIKHYVDKSFGLDIPIPLLTSLLKQISEDINVENNADVFHLYTDGSFIMKKYIFDDYDEMIQKETTEIQIVEKLYSEFIKSAGIKEKTTLLEFIDQQKGRMSKYFANREDEEFENEFIHQARFFKAFREDENIFKILKKLYLGSLITSYLELEITDLNVSFEFLLDTNFILGLLDLNSQESTHTCRKIIELSKKFSFRVSVLPFTIEETKALINRSADYLNNTYAQKQLDPESIYSACDRNSWGKTKLQSFAGKLEKILQEEYEVYIIPNDTSYKNMAKYQYPEVHNFYKKIRETPFSALHDSTAEVYVLEHRKKPVDDFINSKCWFVSNTKGPIRYHKHHGGYPAVIRSDTLVNILWLSNPAIQRELSSDELSFLGLNRLISSTISESLPKARVLKEFDDNLNIYAKDKINDIDCVRATVKIAENTLGGFEEFNSIAKENPDEFVDKLCELSKIKKEEDENFLTSIKSLISEFEFKIETPNKKVKEEIQKSHKTIRWLIYSIIVLFLSFILWTFDILFSVEKFSNYYLIKISCQILILIAPLLIPLKKNWKYWLGLSLSSLFFILGIFK